MVFFLAIFWTAALTEILNEENALGYSFRYYVTELPEDKEKAAEVKMLSVDGVAPTVENIRSGAYPLVTEAVIVTAGSKNPHVEKMVEWFLSEQGQEMIEKTGYVGVNREPATVSPVLVENAANR